MLSINNIENVIIKIDTLANTKFSFFDFSLNVSKLTFKNNGNVKINNIKNNFAKLIFEKVLRTSTLPENIKNIMSEKK